MASRRTPVSKPNVKPNVETTPAKAAPRKRAVPKAKMASPSKPAIDPDVRRAMIAEAAYLRAERRGFAAGGEHEDWMAAEAEVDRLLSADHTATQ
jgi:hypothetical protein